jgi:SagB-type dehydrogenase family enzyme
LSDRANRRERKTASLILYARLAPQIALEAQGDGIVVTGFGGTLARLGAVSPGVASRLADLRTGLPLTALASARGSLDKELELIVRRLARHGLLEYGLRASATGADLVVIEPQLADYWPEWRPLDERDVLALSRFAYMRRRGTEMVIESPLAGALFRICDPQTAAALAMLAAPQPLDALRRQVGFPDVEVLALLVDCRILFKVAAADSLGTRAEEGDGNLVLWDFHDLVFHARSTEGRHANPLGGVYAHADAMPALPAVRPHWPGRKIDLAKHSQQGRKNSPAARVLHKRHSARSFDDRRPITLAELARFLDAAARVSSRWQSQADFGPGVSYAARPYPSAGASYELELYLAVAACKDLARGFYHYDAGRHALVPIRARPQDVETLLNSAAAAMDAPAVPQIAITIAARFGRVSWKYSSLAYALILKDAGVLTQTLYLIATDMGLGGCAIGTVNVELFARMTGIEFHVEGPVGQFALGRPAPGPGGGGR